MKTLLLLRHAKSSWNDASLEDAERPLNARGRRAADAMGALLGRAAPIDRALCSPAVRTRETLERVRTHLATPPEVESAPALYLASAGELLEAVRGVDASVERLLVVAHNPGVHELAVALTGSGPPGERERMRRKYPTGALTELRSSAAAWREVAPGSMELVRFVVPRELPDPR